MKEGQVKQHEKRDGELRRISDFMNDLESMGHQQVLTLEQLIIELGDQAHGFLILLLSFPFLLPIPIPGLSVLFGLVITAVALAWVVGAPPWIPQRFRKAQVPKVLVDRAPSLGRKIFARVEFLIRPRYLFMMDWILLRTSMATVMMLAALFLALPLPPGTNFPPALIIFSMAWSIIERDGLLAILAILLFFVEVYLFWEVISLLFYYLEKFFS